MLACFVADDHDGRTELILLSGGQSSLGHAHVLDVEPRAVHTLDRHAARFRVARLHRELPGAFDGPPRAGRERRHDYRNVVLGDLRATAERASFALVSVARLD